MAICDGKAAGFKELLGLDFAGKLLYKGLSTLSTAEPTERPAMDSQTFANIIAVSQFSEALKCF